MKDDSELVPRDTSRIRWDFVQTLHRQYLTASQQSPLQILPIGSSTNPIPVEHNANKKDFNKKTIESVSLFGLHEGSKRKGSKIQPTVCFNHEIFLFILNFEIIVESQEESKHSLDTVNEHKISGDVSRKRK